MERLFVVFICIMIFIAGCGPGTPEVSAPSKATGRIGTRGLEAASAAGYNGAAVRRSVDSMLDRTDARNAEMKHAMESPDGK